jgi:RES domain-containing protein
MPLEPHPSFARLRRAVERCLPSAGPFRGTVFRSVTPRYATSSDLLSGQGARKHGERWNPPASFATVYTSLTPETALAETLAHYRHYRIPESQAMPRVFVAISVSLERVLDLTVGGVRHALGVSLVRMRREAWRRAQSAGREALTQAIGRAAFEAGLEGLVVPSGPDAAGKNLVVFPASLRRQSRLVVDRDYLLKPS